MISAKSIKDVLVAGLGDRLGDYVVNNARTKAVYIGSKVPITFKAEGLEILISPSSATTNSEPLHGGGVAMSVEYEVRLIERSQGVSLDDVIRWMVAKFQVVRPPTLLQETDMAFQQAVIRIPDYLAVKQP